ncbi:MAG: hypothetical protein Q8S31_08265 [Alphaproteobacteria bacterium]|nr:hypothetical protein [Alphaproteobacteria bacterium]
MKNIIKITFGCAIFLSQAFVTNPIDAGRIKKTSPRKQNSSSNKENKIFGTGLNQSQLKINQFFKPSKSIEQISKSSQPTEQELPLVIDLIESNEITFSNDVNMSVLCDSTTSEEGGSLDLSLSESEGTSEGTSLDVNSDNIDTTMSDLDIIPGEIKIDLTEEDYINTLKNAIQNSQKSLIIASNQISLHKKFKSDLYTLLWRAKHLRNVDIFIFFSTISEDSKGFLDFLNTHEITYCAGKIPANFIITDNNFVALGSADWLSNDNFLTKFISSVSIDGDASEKLINILKNNLLTILNINSNAEQFNQSHTLKIDNENKISYLATQNDHYIFLENLLKTSKNVKIFCPTILGDTNYENYKINKNLISDALNANKDLKITFNFDTLNPFLDELEKDIESLNFFYGNQRCQLWCGNGCFIKNTIIADDTTIIEGSFGWTLKDAKGFSIALSGPKASVEIDRFVNIYEFSPE